MGAALMLLGRAGSRDGRAVPAGALRVTPRAMEDLFAQVLVLAARAGLGRLGLIAVDGTKIAASRVEGREPW